MRVMLEATAQEWVLDGQPLASGGEASIYAVPDQPDLLAKIYHKPSPEHADKLAAMVVAPPEDPMTASGHVSIAWPRGRLFTGTPEEGRRFVGYVMPRIHKVHLIQECYNPKARLESWPMFHYGYLLVTAHNLAAAVRAVHKRGYRIGDINGANLLVNSRALVTLIDTDSFQVPDAGRIYRCRVGTPEYTPPELQGARFAEVDRQEEHDTFGLAILIFQLLMQGTHPFAGVYTTADEPGTIPQRIAAGHWPYARSRAVPYTPSPHAPPLSILPSGVQDLMRRCFEEGHDRPTRRPSAAEWHQVLAAATKELTPCPANDQHVYHRDLTACPWCLLAQRQGFDPFPLPVVIAAESPAPVAPVPAPPRKRVPAPSTMIPSPRKPTLAPVPESRPPDPPEPAREEIRLSPGERTRLEMTPLRALAPARRTLVKFGKGLMIGCVLMVVMAGIAGSIWLANSGWLGGVRPQQQWRGQQEGIASVAFSPDGSKVLSGGRDPLLILWDVQTGTPLLRFGTNGGSSSSVAFFAQGRKALTGSLESDTSIRQWLLKSGEELDPLPGHLDPVTSLAVTRNGSHALSGSRDRRVLWWDLNTGNILQRLTGHQDTVTGVAISADGFRGVSAGDDRTVRVWDLKAARATALFQNYADPFTCVALSPDGNTILAGNRDKTVRVFDIRSDRETVSFKGHKGPVRAVAFAPNGLTAYSGGDDATVRSWDPATGQEHKVALQGYDRITSLAVSPNGRIVVAGSADGTILLWVLAN